MLLLSQQRTRVSAQGGLYANRDQGPLHSLCVVQNCNYTPRNQNEHTKPFQTKLDTQRGFLVGFSHKKAEFRAYFFNVGFCDASTVLEVAWSF
jgi:hypothetical protein